MAATKKTAKKKSARSGGEAAQLESLVRAATDARENAYAPYSRYRVGAAIATKSGRVYVGCNVENAAFPSGICAERGAIASMVAAGDRDPSVCVIVTEGESPAPPCGMCRQVLVEFARHMPVVLIGLPARPGQRVVRRSFDLAALLPEAFTLLPNAPDGPAARRRAAKRR